MEPRVVSYLPDHEEAALAFFAALAAAAADIAAAVTAAMYEPTYVSMV